jgi:hypothetical protein
VSLYRITIANPEARAAARALPQSRSGQPRCSRLPFIRTSPDHGTALDIAGTGKADPTSLIAALKLADEMASRRSGHAALGNVV